MAYSSITKPTDYFKSVLYTGDDTAIGSGGNAITGVGFQPDFVWIKRRTSDAAHHAWYDIVRGTTKQLSSSQTNAESTQSEGLTTLGTDGFTVGSLGRVNEGGGDTYVSWNWLAGGSASSNSDGTISSTVSVNTTAGFSIVSWTGTGDGTPSSSGTLGHGLSSAPKMIIVKNRTDAANWPVYHAGNTSAPETEVIYLNATNATSDDNNFWNDTAPTSSVFTVAGDNGVNGNGDSMIAYVWSEKKGFSKFSNFVGNGNADGTFVYLGFRPAFVIVKRTDSSTNGNWVMHDNKRANSFNEIDARLFPNTNDTESSNGNGKIDFLSNGFKYRTSSDGQNGSGNEMIYMAFAENPFVGNDSGTAVPVVAR